MSRPYLKAVERGPVLPDEAPRPRRYHPIRKTTLLCGRCGEPVLPGQLYGRAPTPMHFGCRR